MKKSVLFFGKQNDAHCEKALKFLYDNFESVQAYLGNWHEPFPQAAMAWEGDYIISFLSRWIIPTSTLKKAKEYAVNFHPAPPNYPGIGGYNYALYEEARTYGVTCHHMSPVVDTGDIVAVVRFPIFLTDDVSSLLSRTYDYQLVLFYQLIGDLLIHGLLPKSDEVWAKPPVTRKEFLEFCEIRPEMDPVEMAKRIRATNYGHFKPKMNFKGFEWELKDSHDK